MKFVLLNIFLIFISLDSTLAQLGIFRIDPKSGSGLVSPSASNGMVLGMPGGSPYSVPGSSGGGSGLLPTSLFSGLLGNILNPSQAGPGILGFLNSVPTASTTPNSGIFHLPSLLKGSFLPMITEMLLFITRKVFDGIKGLLFPGLKM